jgi:hypothetical protein
MAMVYHVKSLEYVEWPIWRRTAGPQGTILQNIMEPKSQDVLMAWLNNGGWAEDPPWMHVFGPVHGTY